MEKITGTILDLIVFLQQEISLVKIQKNFIYNSPEILIIFNFKRLEKIDFLEDLMNKGNQGGNKALRSVRNSNTTNINNYSDDNFNENGNIINPKTSVFSNFTQNSNFKPEKMNLDELVDNRLSRSQANFKKSSNRLENKNLASFQALRGHDAAINCLILMKGKNNEYVIVTGGQDCQIRIWHYLTGECLKILSGHLDSVSSLTKIKRKGLIISTGDDRLIKIWDFNSCRCLKTLQGHSHWIKKVIFIKWERNDSTIVTASSDKTIRIWNIETDICNVLKGHKHEVISLTQVRWLRDQSTIASGSWKEIKLWNIITGENISTFANNKNWIRSLVHIKNHLETDYLVSASNSEIKLWNLQNGKCVNSFDTEDSYISFLCELKVKQKDIIVASAGSDNTVNIWNVETSRLINKLIGSKDIVKGIAQPDKDDEFVILTAGADRTIRYWK
jgi:WD40 repeat protein